ncbi:MAG: DUF485 domain-containing protein [Cystobacterineae bacterium]|nr:DUF485 domain-containing protein [Cystobacterineae bacterium]
MRLPLCLAIFVLLISGSYYALIAFAPQALRAEWGGFPLSILCGLGVFVAGAALGLLYAFMPSAKTPPTPKEVGPTPNTQDRQGMQDNPGKNLKGAPRPLSGPQERRQGFEGHAPRSSVGATGARGEASGESVEMAFKLGGV